MSFYRTSTSYSVTVSLLSVGYSHDTFTKLFSMTVTIGSICSGYLAALMVTSSLKGPQPYTFRALYLNL